MYSFSADVSCSSSFEVTLRSAARTMPSLARMPIAVPAWEMASRAYSTWYRRPSGEKMVVCQSLDGIELEQIAGLVCQRWTHSGIVAARHGEKAEG